MFLISTFFYCHILSSCIDTMTYGQIIAAKCRICVCTGNIAQPHLSETNHVWLCIYLYIKQAYISIYVNCNVKCRIYLLKLPFNWPLNAVLC